MPPALKEPTFTRKLISRAQRSLLMANKGRRRKFNLRRVRIASASAAGALAAGDVVSNQVTDATSNTVRFMSVNASYAWSDLGGGADDACTFGLAHSDYTAAEVEECLEAGASMDIGNKVAREQANRLVRQIGTITGSSGGVGSSGFSFNEGNPVKTRLNWLMSIGDRLHVWIRNSSGVVWTTGSSVTINGDLWVKD